MVERIVACAAWAAKLLQPEIIHAWRVVTSPLISFLHGGWCLSSQGQALLFC
jgi:hypothetical protein